MSQTPKPRDKMTKGSVNTTSSGFRIVLNKLSRITTTASVVPLS